MTPYLFGIIKMDRPAWIKYLLAKGIPWNTYEISELIQGTTLSLVDSIKRPLIDFSISGNTIQEGTPSPESPQAINSVGDNENEVGLNDIAETTLDGLTYSASDGILSVNGTATNKVNIQSIPFTLSGNTTKTLKIYLDSGTANIDTRIGLSFRDSSNTQIDYIQSRVDEPNTKTLTLTDLDHIYLYIVNGSALTNAKIRFKLEQGSQATSYSPYNMGSIAIEKCNKNLFDIDSEYWKRRSTGTVTINNNTVEIVNSETQAHQFVWWNMPVKVGEQIVISYENLVENVSDTNSYVSYMFSDTPIITFTAFNDFTQINKTNKSVNTTSTKKYLAIGIRIAPERTILLSNLQVEYGSSATTYIPHQSTTYSIYTQAPMRSIGDTRDDFVKNNGVWYERHKIGRVVLDGTEEGWFSGESGGYFRVAIAITDKLNEGATRKDDILCNYFKSSTTQNYGGCFNHSENVYFIPNSDITTLADFKSWLSTHNTEVIYQLAEPTLTECTSEQVEQLENIVNSDTYNGGTNIYSVDIVPPYLGTKYWKVR